MFRIGEVVYFPIYKDYCRVLRKNWDYTYDLSSSRGGTMDGGYIGVKGSDLERLTDIEKGKKIAES